MLYWVEEKSDGTGRLMKSQTDGTNIQPFFSASASNFRSVSIYFYCFSLETKVFTTLFKIY